MRICVRVCVCKCFFFVLYVLFKDTFYRVSPYERVIQELSLPMPRVRKCTVYIPVEVYMKVPNKCKRFCVIRFTTRAEVYTTINLHQEIANAIHAAVLCRALACLQPFPFNHDCNLCLALAFTQATALAKRTPHILPQPTHV